MTCHAPSRDLELPTLYPGDDGEAPSPPGGQPIASAISAAMTVSAASGAQRAGRATVWLRRLIAGLVAGVVVVLFPPGPVAAAAAADLPTVIGNITDWIVGLLVLVATLFLTYGGLRYVMAGGDPAEVDKAKSALKNALVGYAVAILAPILLGIVQGWVGV